MLGKSLKTLIRVLCCKGEKFLEERKHKEALKFFQEARGFNPSAPDTYVSIADVLMRMGRYEEAVNSLNRAQKLFELQLYSEGAPEESINEILEKAGKAYFNPPGASIESTSNFGNNPKTCYYLAICWKNLGEIEKGLGFLKKAAKELFEELNNPERQPDGSLFAGIEFFEGPEKTFREAETLEAAGIFAKAFNLLSSLVYERIITNYEIRSLTASR
jgi:tetratricopeptide (TPR) repeat protein